MDFNNIYYIIKRKYVIILISTLIKIPKTIFSSKNLLYITIASIVAILKITINFKLFFYLFLSLVLVLFLSYFIK